MWNPIKRFWRYIKGVTNAKLEKMENAEDVLDQTVEDMKTELDGYERNLVEAKVNLKKLQREAQKHGVRAQELAALVKRAVESRNDGLAKELLIQKRDADGTVKVYADSILAHTQNIEKTAATLSVLKAKIVRADNKKLALKERSKLAALQKSLAESTSSIINQTDGSAFATFDRIESNVEDQVNRAEIASEIANGGVGSVEEMKLLEFNEIDKELAELKAQFLLTENPDKKS